MCEYEPDDVFDAMIETRTPPRKMWRFTDDTNMALSIYEILRLHSHIDQTLLVRSFILHFDRFRHYGRGIYNWVDRCVNGEPWSEVSRTLFYDREGSFGNGGAMRSAPLGAFFADDVPLLIEQARLSAEVTHAHPEGIAGAVAVAVAAAMAWQARSHRLKRSEFLARIIAHLPQSAVKQGVQKALSLPPSINTAALASLVLGNGRQISAQDTVPLALWISGTCLYDYEEAIWQAISHGGDVDTLAAIVGGIVALSAGASALPAAWLQQREPLPAWAVEI